MPVDRRIIDLTRRLVPGEEPFTCEVKTFFVEELLPQFHRQPDDWYILQEWKLSSHVGTHVESPFHHLRDGTNVGGLDLGALMGEAVVLDFTGRRPDEEITPEDLARLAADVRPGDIVLVHTGYDRDYGKTHYGRP